MRTGTQKLRWSGVSAIAISVGLSGCAQTVNGLAANQGQHGLNPDTVQQHNHPPKSLVKELSPQSLWETPIDPAKPANELRGDWNPNSRNEGVDTCDRNKNTFCELQERSRNKDDDPIIARNYLLVGITLSNELCDVWFNKLYSTQITFRQTSDIISATGSLSAAILGYSRADSRVSGLTASVFGVGKQITDSVVANYVIAPDLTAVAVAVREYRSLYASKLESAPNQWNYFTARRAIMAYDNSCSALSVKRFINARISGVQPEESPKPLFEIATYRLLVEWKSKFKIPVNTVADLVDIYAYLTVSDELVNETLKNDAKSLDTSLVFFNSKHDLQELVSDLREASIMEYMNSLVYKKVSQIKTENNFKIDKANSTSNKSDGSSADVFENAASKLIAEGQKKFKSKVKTVSDLVDIYAYEEIFNLTNTNFGTLSDEEKNYIQSDATKLSGKYDFYNEKYSFADLKSDIKKYELTEYMNYRVREKLFKIRAEIAGGAENTNSPKTEASGMPNSSNGKPVDVAPR